MFRCTIMLLLVVVLMGSFATPASAQTQSDTSPGLDIVFIVDQSGSMSRGSLKKANDPRCPSSSTDPACRTEPSDPQNLALKALPAGITPIFEQMVQRSLGRQRYELAKEEYRFGLVLFGGPSDPPTGKITLRIAIPLTRIEIQTDSNGNKTPNLLDQLPTVATNMEETAFSSAFDAACEMLDCTTPAAPNRKRVVVLLTDGRPSGDVIDFQNANPEPYFRALQKKHAAFFANTELWVIGLDKRNVFWSNIARFWEEIAPGRTELITNPESIAARFRKIAADSVGAPPGDPRNCDGTSFTVDPYKESLTLILEYPDINSRARFKLPDSSYLTRTNDIVYARSTQSESFVIKNPVPGKWSCEIVGTGVEPTFRDIQGLFRLTDLKVEHTAGPPASTCRDFGLTVSYRDADDKVIKELPEYPLKHTATITIAGAPITRNLIPESDARDHWKVDGDLQPSLEGGSYPVQVDVKLQDGRSIFHDSHQTVVIDPKLPCMQLTAPTANSVSETFNRLQPATVEVAVQLTQGGQPGTPEAVFRESLDQILTCEITGPGGLRRTVALVPASSPGKFCGPGCWLTGNWLL